LNISVDSEVTKWLADMQRRTKIADPEKFQQFVREQTGMSYEDYRNDVKNGMLQQRVVRQEVSSRINIKKEDLQKYYDEHKDEFQREERVYLRNILISTEGKDEAGIAAAEKKAKDLSARGKKGERFPELAQANSDDQNTADQGGDMGQWFKKGELLPAIETAVWPQARGYVTDPIKLGNGFMIFKVEEHQQAGLATFEEVENEIMDKLFRPRMDPETRKYLTKLRTEAFLEIKPGYEDSGAAPGKNTAWTDPAQLKPETVTKAQVSQEVRRKRLLWMMPVPGTSTNKTGTSSSR
jgi:parvulin-like peptidyl-prolyl isomerase